MISLQETVLSQILDKFNAAYLESQTLQPAVEQMAPPPQRQPGAAVRSGVYTPCDLRLIMKGETLHGHVQTRTKTSTLRGWKAGTVHTWQNACADRSAVRVCKNWAMDTQFAWGGLQSVSPLTPVSQLLSADTDLLTRLGQGHLTQKQYTQSWFGGDDTTLATRIDFDPLPMNAFPTDRILRGGNTGLKSGEDPAAVDQATFLKAIHTMQNKIPTPATIQKAMQQALQAYKFPDQQAVAVVDVDTLAHQLIDRNKGVGPAVGVGGPGEGAQVEVLKARLARAELQLQASAQGWPPAETTSGCAHARTRTQTHTSHKHTYTHT